MDTSDALNALRRDGGYLALEKKDPVKDKPKWPFIIAIVTKEPCSYSFIGTYSNKNDKYCSAMYNVYLDPKDIEYYCSFPETIPNQEPELLWTNKGDTERHRTYNVKAAYVINKNHIPCNNGRYAVYLEENPGTMASTFLGASSTFKKAKALADRHWRENNV